MLDSNTLISGKEEAIHSRNFCIGKILYGASDFKDFNNNEVYGRLKIEVAYHCIFRPSLFLYHWNSDPLTWSTHNQLTDSDSWTFIIRKSVSLFTSLLGVRGQVFVTNTGRKKILILSVLYMASLFLARKIYCAVSMTDCIIIGSMALSSSFKLWILTLPLCEKNLCHTLQVYF